MPAAKSRADKRGGSSVQPSTPSSQDQEMDDNFPGSLTQIELNDEKEKAVTETMDDLMAMVMDGCFQVYIKRQLVTFSAFLAKRNLTEVLECQFICLDETEKLDEATTTEDAEPMPLTSDAWALGCVPVLKATHQRDPALHQENIIDSVPAKINPKVNLPSDVLAQKIIIPMQDEKDIIPMQDEKDRSSKEPANDDNFRRKRSFSPTEKERKNHQIIISPKEVPDKLLPPLSCSTKDTVNGENNNMTSSGSSLMSKPSQSHKETQTVSKLHASSLPRHLIFPVYEIVETCKAKAREKIQGGHSRKT